MGSVERVWDEERQEEVARKRILGGPGEGLIRFKREFRTIAEVRHENLVRLYELDEDDLGPYFTMEYVRGSSLLLHCAMAGWSKDALTATQPVAIDSAAIAARLPRVSGVLAPVVATIDGWRCNWERLDQVVPQIARALDHLHASGVVHCDLKPSNALVSEVSERCVVKLLDFGIVAEMRGRHGPGNAILAGTPAYMAPERLGGAPAAPPVDLYALGVTLFEMITGALPFDDASSLAAMRRMQESAPRLDARVPDAPARYVALCAGLLQKDPTRRATTRDVLDALGQTARSLPPLRPRGEGMVGRTILQAALRGLAEATERGAFDCANLQGPSGAGKTALTLWLAHDLERAGWLVLRGRASTSEHVAFNALDGAIDDLAGALASKERRLLARDLAAHLRDAATLFPVLRDAMGPLPEGAGPHEIAAKRGTRGFDAIVALLQRVAVSTPVLLVVDDLQWADADSLALLDAVVGAAPARVLVVMTTRDDVGDARALPWLRKRRIEPLHVGPLDDEAVYEVIARAARTGGIRAGRETIQRVASAAAGRPFLAEALGRALAHDPEAAGDPLGGVAAAIERASEEARALLSFALAAGGWTSIATLAQVMDRKAGEVTDLVSDLESEGLVRRDAAGGKLGAVDIYHDQVRERALGLLDPRAMSSAHDRFVAWFSERRGTPKSVIVRHLVGAGRFKEAAALAREAASVAEQQRAFGLASAMYEVALREPSSDRIALLRKQALVQERVGSYTAAAACWREIALSVVDPEERNEAILHEAHALLGSDEVARGYARLNEGLAARGEPQLNASKAGDLWSGIGFLVGAMSSAGPSASVPLAPPDVEARAQREMAIGRFVAYADPLAGTALMRRARSRAARAGAYDTTAICDFTFAYFALFGARKSGRVPLYERFRARADKFAAGRPQEAENAAWPMFLDGVVAMREAEWDRAAERMDAASESLQRAGQIGTQSIMYILFARAEVEMWRQNAFGYQRTYERVRAAVEESGTGTMRCQLDMAAALIRVWAGDADGGAEMLTELYRSWPVDVRTVQRFIIAGGLQIVQTIRGETAEARELATRLMAGEFGYNPLHTIYATSFANSAALAEVAALRSGDPKASAARVRKYARISAEGPPFTRTPAARALAYLDEHLGQPEAALARLEVAERESLRLTQRVDAAIARFIRGKRLGGDTGHGLMLSARALLAEVGVTEKVLTLSEYP